jgi:NADPH-dependent ferric siderophore reductase
MCEIVTTTKVSTSVYEVVVRGDASTLAGEPGNDVMLRFEGASGGHVRRRYSVRELDATNDTFTLWVTVDHEGPGTAWVRTVQPGDAIEVIGPRGKILVDPLAKWHLFMVDVSALASFYRMAQSITEPGHVDFVVEIDAPDDALTATFPDQLRVRSTFVDRQRRALSDPEGLLRGLANVALPSGRGHAYLFGEFHVSRALQSALIDRGLEPAQISHKAFWRAGRSNADHGEPVKSDT